MSKTFYAVAAATLLFVAAPAYAEPMKTFQCFRLDKDAPVTGDQWSLTTRQFEVEAIDDGTGYDAIRKCTEKLNDEKKRANRRVMRA